RARMAQMPQPVVEAMSRAPKWWGAHASVPTMAEPVATTDGLRLQSNLWLDQDDYEAHVDEKLRHGAISPAQAEVLLRFASDGYVVLDLDVEAALLDRVVAEVAALWGSRP